MKKIFIPLACGILAAKVFAGIPVIDGTNVSQTTISALQNVAAVLKQVQQYSMQLQQYEDQLKNSLAPAAYIWDQAQDTMSKLQDAQSELERYKNSLGSIDQFVNTYLSSSSYNSSCLAKGVCSAAELAKISENATVQNDIEKNANDAAFKSLSAQQSSLNADASKLDRIQRSAQSAQGRMEALGAANQLAAAQANQLMKIRQMLISQYNAITAKMASDQAEEAQSKAIVKSMYSSGINSVFTK